MSGPPVETTSIFKDDVFKGKIVLCSGGGSGICRGMTEALVRHGAKAVIISRSLDKLEKAASEMRQITGGEIVPVQADVRKPQDLIDAVDKTIKLFGRIDILINGAAGNFLAPVEHLSFNAFRTVIEIDLLGTFNLTKAALPHLKRSKGSVLNVSATLAYNGTPFQSHAGSAKAGIDALTRHLATEFGPFGVRVNALAPGPISGTVGMEKLNRSYEDDIKKSTKSVLEMSIPLQRYGQIKDIEQATMFLCSEGANWITGALLVVDGGAWLTAPIMVRYPEDILNSAKL